MSETVFARMPRNSRLTSTHRKSWMKKWKAERRGTRACIPVRASRPIRTPVTVHRRIGSAPFCSPTDDKAWLSSSTGNYYTPRLGLNDNAQLASHVDATAATNDQRPRLEFYRRTQRAKMLDVLSVLPGYAKHVFFFARRPP
ncbi:unnamed protein product [Mycena citricolor]|uniref:Uncharacterized protein n=1 Tax=Mycena citricolor TaxID=2018698 RepID=A0AAD2JVW4_9AGAR|nr:unnamed protein product [Mycena citricolor]